METVNRHLRNVGEFKSQAVQAADSINGDDTDFEQEFTALPERVCRGGRCQRPGPIQPSPAMPFGDEVNPIPHQPSGRQEGIQGLWTADVR